MKYDAMQQILEKYEMHLDSQEPPYLAAIRHAFSGSRHKIPSPPSRSYYDPGFRREKETESFVRPSDNISSVSGWVSTVMLFLGTASERRGRHLVYGLGGSLLVDDTLVLEIVDRGTAESDAHWQMKAARSAIGQLWRCLRSHGIADPRTRSVTIVANSAATQWLAPSERPKRAKLGARVRLDWTAVTSEIDKWRSMRWVHAGSSDPWEIRSERLAKHAMR